MSHTVFSDSAAQTLLRILSRECIAIRSIELLHDPPISVVIPDGNLYRRYLAQLAPDGESLAEVHLEEQLAGWYGDDESAVLLELVEDRDGSIRWSRTPR